MILEKEMTSVVIEGGDQVGKGDALNELCKELSENGYEVSPLSFPCYGTPLGFSIRSLLTGKKIPEELNIPNDEFLDIKMGLFAMNRLEILNSILTKQEFSNNKIFLLDRSPYSNALTIAYHLAKNGMCSDKELEEITSRAMEMESFIIETMRLDQCVIRLYEQQGVWTPQREKEDLHDNPEVQEVSGKVYESMSKFVGEGWKDIPTRIAGDWRPREKILEDNMEFVIIRLGLNNEEDTNGGVAPFDISKVARDLYQVDLDRGLSMAFNTAVKENDKKGLYFAGEATARNAVSKVSAIAWCSEDIKFAVREILRYSNNFEKVLNYIYGDNFGTKFVNSVL